ncbi:MAG: DUF2735 domain-containing protein [Rhodopseudomonas palustris]|uniref:DUF2735 domain-containing protein n=1 Tax=Rhodopseudomonas palustris TaxID=1076 RepID=A0A933RZQ4_RHOPL|nr:DUF2735 domain-containing protein [Rhodopseudomonas palustris]
MSLPNLNQTSAKIYQFPVGGRGGLVRREPAHETTTQSVVTSSSWYHEAAMLDEQPRKPQ